MKGWVGLVCWPIADGLPTLVVTHQLQVERRTGKVRRPETGVLPLCHATNFEKIIIINRQFLTRHIMETTTRAHCCYQWMFIILVKLLLVIKSDHIFKSDWSSCFIFVAGWGTKRCDQYIFVSALLSVCVYVSLCVSIRVSHKLHV